MDTKSAGHLFLRSFIEGFRYGKHEFYAPVRALLNVIRRR